MRDMRNFVELIGNTGTDVNVITFDSGTKKASVPFATSSYYKNEKGEFVSTTQWHNVIAWGKNAELFKKAVSKGDYILVRGSINYRSYQDKQGIQRSISEIVMDNFAPMSQASPSKPIEKLKAKKQKEELPF